MRSYLLLLFFLWSPAVIAREKPADRTCRILFLSPPPEVSRKFHLFDGVTSQEVEPGTMGFSPVYRLSSGDISLALLPNAPRAAKAGVPPAIPAGAPNANLAAAITDFHLLLSSDPANPVAPVRMRVIDADATNFKRGQMLWFNLTECKVGGILGSRKLLIQPNARLVLDAPATGLEDYQVNIHFQPPGKTRPEPLCETRWTHDPRSRSVFFVLRPAGSLIPRILGFPDFRSQETSKPQGAP